MKGNVRSGAQFLGRRGRASGYEDEKNKHT